MVILVNNFLAPAAKGKKEPEPKEKKGKPEPKKEEKKEVKKEEEKKEDDALAGGLDLFGDPQ